MLAYEDGFVNLINMLLELSCKIQLYSTKLLVFLVQESSNNEEIVFVVFTNFKCIEI